MGRPVDGILAPEYADERRELIGETAFDGRVEPGDPAAFGPAADLVAASTGREGAVFEDVDGDTIHLTVSDADGNVVSYTSTIVSIGGNGMVVPGHGERAPRPTVSWS